MGILVDSYSGPRDQLAACADHGAPTVCAAVIVVAVAAAVDKLEVTGNDSVDMFHCIDVADGGGLVGALGSEA